MASEFDDGFQEVVNVCTPKTVMIDVGHLKIVAEDGNGIDTKVYIDGKLLHGVRSVALAGSVDSAWIAKIEVIPAVARVEEREAVMENV